MKKTARIAGALYLISIVARIFADGVVRDRIVVGSDAAATASNILANESLFRWGFAADIISFASYVALAAVLYTLFKPVSRTLSLTAAFLGLTSGITQAFSSVFHLAALSVLKSSGDAQLALLLLKVREIGYHNVGLVFLGFYCMTLGYLAYRSRFMPRITGVLMGAAGLAYMAFLSQPLASSLLPNLLIPAGVGQIAFTLWLLIFAVKVTPLPSETAARQ